MRYIILDDDGKECGGTLCKQWNSMQDYAEDSSKYYYAGDLRVLFLFEESEIKDDVERLATVQGKAAMRRLTSKDGEKASLAITLFQEVVEEENYPWAKRVMGLAVSECETLLYRLSKSRITGNRSLDNGRDFKEEYCIELKVDDTFSDTTANKLLRTIHDYIVSRVLFEWASITYEELNVLWAGKVEADTKEIEKEAKRSGSGDAKITQSWV